MCPVGVFATMGIAGVAHLAAVTDQEWLEPYAGSSQMESSAGE